MGWWRDKYGRLLGDGPADVVGQALADAAHGGVKPTLSAVIGLVGGILRRQPGRYAAVAADDWRIVATAAGTPVVEDPTIDPAWERAISELLDDLAEQYRISELARLPTIDEVVGTFDFVLAHEPERLVDGAVTPLTISRRPAT